MYANSNDGGCYDTAKRPKYRATKRKEFVENWECYLKFPKIFTVLPPKIDPNGEDGKYCFLCWENGIDVPTREPELVMSAISGKMSLNLQIEMWAGMMWEKGLGCCLYPDELRDYTKDMPNWVFTAVMEQVKKRVIEDIGWLPSFLDINKSIYLHPEK